MFVLFTFNAGIDRKELNILSLNGVTVYAIDLAPTPVTVLYHCCLTQSELSHGVVYRLASQQAGCCAGVVDVQIKNVLEPHYRKVVNSLGVIGIGDTLVLELE